jgi:thiamine pyrophosphokinase
MGRHHALVIADGGHSRRDLLDVAWPGWDDEVELVVVADGGVRLADALGLPIHRWVGDGDSIEPDRLATLRALGIPVNLVAGDKDESDTELAVLAAIAGGAGELTILGALGGSRIDHALANISLLAHPALRDRTARLLADDASISLISAPDADGRPVDRPLPGRPGDLVSLLPYGPGVEGVTTRGMRYPLRDEPLPAGPARGLSNLRHTRDAGVIVRRGLLLVVETPVNLDT